MGIEQTGVNKAGYPEFRRTKDVKNESKQDEPKKIGRRGFLGFLAAGGAGAAFTLPKVFEDDTRVIESQPDLHSEGLGSVIEDNYLESEAVEEEVSEESEQENVESEEVMSESKYFNEIVEKYKKAYEAELHHVEPFVRKTTVGDEDGRSRIEYVTEMLQVRGVSETVQQELRKYIAGVCFEESRYDGSKKSKVGAVGVLQIMPATWEEHGDANGNPLGLIDQVEAAGNLMSQAARYLEKHCADDFLAIQTEFFHGDTEAFEKCFLVPVIINAYNAGQGNMRKVVEWFGRTYGTEEKTKKLLGQEELLSGYDVFLAMARSAKKTSRGKKPAPNYGDHASRYTAKIYGATKCLEENRLLNMKA